MAELYLRQGSVIIPTATTQKDAPLTNVEVDSNFISLNDGINEVSSQAQEDAISMAIALGG